LPLQTYNRKTSNAILETTFFDEGRSAIYLKKIAERKNNPTSYTGVLKKLSQTLAESKSQLLWDVALRRYS
jgi:hypothetical protein